MANTKAEYVGDGVTDTFAIVFPRISDTHVEVYVNNIKLETPLYWSVQGGNVVFVTPPGDQALIRIQRNTDVNNRLVDYNDGAVLTEEELDLDSKQAFYLAQEVKENYSDLIENATVALATNLGIVVTDPDAVVDQLVLEVLADPLAATLQARINDIDLNAQNILSLTGIVDGWGVNILANESDITALDVRVTAAESDILAAAGVGSANAGAISALDVRVTENEGDITASAADITTLQATVDLRNRTFRQPTAPTADNIGDIWIDTDDNNKIYRWNGTIWEDSHDGQISANAAQLTTLESRVTTAEGDIASAEVTILANTNATVTNSGDIANLEAKYGVTLNVNGYITGFEQFNNGSSGTFQIMADNFYIVDPANGGQNPTIPFAVTGGVVYMDNVTVRSSAGSGQRIVLNSATNEAEFFGNRGDATIEKLATIGITPLSGDNFIGYFGSTAAGHSNVALYGASNTDFGGYFVSVGERALYAVSQAANRAAINGVSAPASGSGTGVWGEGTYVTGAGVPVGVYGTAGSSSGGYGVHGRVFAGSQSGYGVYCEHSQTRGIPLFVKPDVTNTTPETTGISEGSIWTQADGNGMMAYVDSDWHDVAGRKTHEAIPSGTIQTDSNAPAGCRRVVVGVRFVSTSGTSQWVLRLGDSGGIKTSGYNSSGSFCGATNGGWNLASGVGLTPATGSASYYMCGHIWIERAQKNSRYWIVSALLSDVNGSYTYQANGIITLSGDLTTVSLTTVGGTDTFDGTGDLSFTYEV
jgi:hypothetical protein